MNLCASLYFKLSERNIKPQSGPFKCKIREFTPFSKAFPCIQSRKTESVVCMCMCGTKKTIKIYRHRVAQMGCNLINKLTIWANSCAQIEVKCNAALLANILVNIFVYSLVVCMPLPVVNTFFTSIFCIFCLRYNFFYTHRCIQIWKICVNL